MTFSISLEDPCGCGITTSGFHLKALRMQSSSRARREAKLARAEFTAATMQKERALFLPPPADVPLTMPHLSVTHQAVLFKPDSSPPPESQPREHKQRLMVPGLGSKAFPNKMGNMVGHKLFTFSLNHTYILRAAVFWQLEEL